MANTDVPLHSLCLQDILESEQTCPNLFDIYKRQYLEYLDARFIFSKFSHREYTALGIRCKRMDMYF